MSKYGVLILDLDATIFDTFPHFLQFMRAAAERNNWPIGDAFETGIAASFGAPTGIFASTCWPNIRVDTGALQEELDTFNEDVMPAIFEGAAEALRALSTQRHIYTGRLRQNTMRVLRYHDLTRFFAGILTRSDVARCKPDPEGVNKIIENTARSCLIPRENFLMVGDCWGSDGLCARAAGIDFLAVAESVHVSRASFLANGVADRMIIDRFADLPAWLENI